MREMNFSTDVFLSSLKEMLDGLSNDFSNDMVHDAMIVATRLKENDGDALNHMREIGDLAQMTINLQHDCQTLFNEFDKRFRCDYGSGEHSATALDTMKIITEIGNDIEDIAPHISWLFEPEDKCIPSIFRDSFVETFTVPAG